MSQFYVRSEKVNWKEIYVENENSTAKTKSKERGAVSTEAPVAQ